MWRLGNHCCHPRAFTPGHRRRFLTNFINKLTVIPTSKETLDGMPHWLFVSCLLFSKNDRSTRLIRWRRRRWRDGPLSLSPESHVVHWGEAIS